MQTLVLPELDTHLCYHDLPGEEPACVYLHGLGSASSADFPRIAHNPQVVAHRAVLIDLLGFGFSDHPDAFPHTLAAHATTVARVLDHLGVRDCLVLGHSMGGSIAITLAAVRPDLVASLIVAECNLDPEDATFSGMIVEESPTEDAYVATGHTKILALAEGWARSEPESGSYLGTLRAADPRAVYRCSVALVACHLRETFFALGIPRTYLFGSQTLPHPHQALLEAGGVPIAVIPEVGHSMMGEAPEAVAAIVAARLAGDDLPVRYRPTSSAPDDARSVVVDLSGLRPADSPTG